MENTDSASASASASAEPSSSELPEPSAQSLPCEVCEQAVHYLRVTTPPGMPDFIHSLDDYAWIGWSWSEPEQALSLIATCSRACLGEWWINQTQPGL